MTGTMGTSIPKGAENYEKSCCKHWPSGRHNLVYFLKENWGSAVLDFTAPRIFNKLLIKCWAKSRKSCLVFPKTWFYMNSLQSVVTLRQSVKMRGQEVIRFFYPTGRHDCSGPVLWRSRCMHIHTISQMQSGFRNKVPQYGQMLAQKHNFTNAVRSREQSTTV